MALKIENVIQMFQELSEYQWTKVEVLAEKMRVDIRTIMRYKKEIDMAFSPAFSIESSKFGYRLYKNDFLEVIRQKEDYESLAALFSTPLGGLVKPKIKYPQSLINKIKDLIEIKGTAPDDILKNLFKALKNGNYLKIQYTSKKTMKEHYGVPIKIFLDFGLIYLSFFDTKYGHMILMNVSKVQSLSLTKEVMKMNEIQEYRQYLNSAWGKMMQHDKKKILKVKFQVMDEVLPYFIKIPLHSSQEISQKGSKTFISLTIHNSVEFIRWSLRFGRAVKIIEPQEVIQELFDYLKDIEEYYTLNF